MDILDQLPVLCRVSLYGGKRVRESPAECVKKDSPDLTEK